MKHHADGYRRRALRGLACLVAACVGLAPLISAYAGFAAVVLVPEFTPTLTTSVGTVGTVVARGAAANAGTFASGVRLVASSVVVAGSARVLTGIGVAVAATAGVVLAAYCWSHGEACAAKANGALAWLNAGKIIWDAEAKKWIYTDQVKVEGTVFCANDASPNGPIYCEISGELAALNYMKRHPGGVTWNSASLADSTGAYYSYDVHGRYCDQFAQCSDTTAQVTVVTEHGFAIKTELRDATSQDLENAATLSPLTTPSTLHDTVLNTWPEELPIPVNAPQIVPQIVALSSPYPGPTPEKGWLQDYAKISPKPDTEAWNDVDVDTGTAIVDNPDTVPVEGPGDVTDTDDPAKTDDKQDQLCDLYPDILACQKMGDAPNDQMPKKTVDVSFSAESVNLPSACPDDIPLGQGRVISYASSCQAATAARPLVITLATLSALLLVVAVIRRG